jgi:hypothetical protein
VVAGRLGLELEHLVDRRDDLILDAVDHVSQMQAVPSSVFSRKTRQPRGGQFAAYLVPTVGVSTRATFRLQTGCFHQL